MDTQCAKVPEPQNADDNGLQPDNLFEENCDEQVDCELPTNSLWNLSDDSILFLSGFDSSHHTSEASEFTSLSELGYSNNPSSIFNQSLGILDSARPSADYFGNKGQSRNTRKEDDSKSEISELLSQANLPELYNNPLLSGDVEGGLGWCLDLFESVSSTQQSGRTENNFSVITGSFNLSDSRSGISPEINNTLELLTPRERFENFQNSLGPIGQTQLNVEIEQGDLPESRQLSEEIDNPISTNIQMPWEWHSLEMDHSGTSPSSDLFQPSKPDSTKTPVSNNSNDSIENNVNLQHVGEDTTGKADRRKPKPIAKRFQPTGSVTVHPSYVQCLNVVLDYHGYTGIITRIVLNNAITNVAYQKHDTSDRSSLMRRPLAEFYAVPNHEEVVGALPSNIGASDKISVISGVLQRKIHMRDITYIVNTVKSIAYVKSGRFSIHNPYEPQYYRYELDANGKAVNESKCGMCAFCPTVKFLPFKNSSYLSHMTLEHGIFASNFVVPEGLYYGRYRMARSTDPSKTRTVKALQCPACLQVIEVACWKNKSNPLLSYFRHFKKLHSNLNKTFTTSSIDPVTLKHRSGNSAHNETLSSFDPHKH